MSDLIGSYGAEVPRSDQVMPATGLDSEAMAAVFSGGLHEENPLVGVIMGSDSDLSVMAHTTQTLRELGISYEPRVVSAHRTPELMMYYGHTAVARGLKVIIAGAGGSAHLPGDMASLTPLPVLGVAIEKTPDPVNAALGSMVEMPAEGGPLATMGKNKAAAINAALFAGRILGLSDPELMERVVGRMQANAATVLEKSMTMARIGDEQYLAGMEAKQ